MGYRTRSLVVSDFHSETKGSRFTSMCRGELCSNCSSVNWVEVVVAGFPTGVENMGGLFKIWWGEWLKSIHEGAWGRVKMLSKNTCEGVHLIIKLLAISLQAYKFTKNEFLHTYFSRILARF